MSSSDVESQDVRANRLAACIQAKHAQWLIMWSPWRKQFTAFGRIAPVAIIIDQADPGNCLKPCEPKNHAVPSHDAGQQTVFTGDHLK